MNKQFYERWWPYVLTIVRRYGVPTHDQRDVVQDIFLRLIKQYHQYDATKGDVRPWLRTVAVGHTIDYLRRRHRFTTEDLDVLKNHPYTVADLQDLDAEYLFQLIDKLPTGFRTVFNLHVVEGYSHQEIAERLSITPAGSRSQLSRAKSLLRRHLTKPTILNHAL